MIKQDSFSLFRLPSSLFLLPCFLFSTSGFACDCPPLKPIDNADLSYYHLIFEGTVDSVVSDGRQGTAHFILKDLYLGSAPQEVPVNFDDSSDCRMSFAKGETWMIYARYERFGKPAVLFCSRSRKLFADEKQDFYTVTSGNTYSVEKEYLLSELGKKNISSKKINDNPGPSNIHPDPTTSLIFVLISIPFLLLFYYLFRRFFK
jgi:hypothetical protein